MNINFYLNNFARFVLSGVFRNFPIESFLLPGMNSKCASMVFALMNRPIDAKSQHGIIHSPHLNMLNNKKGHE